MRVPVQETFPLIKPVRSPFASMGERGPACVLGLGNVLLSDDGVGVHAAAALRAQYRFSPAIDIIDGGTMGLDLLPLFQDRDRILIIDAVDFRKPPGHVDMVEGSAISTVLNTKLSVHHIGLADLLFAAKLTRETAPELCLVGIQPHSLKWGVVLTPATQAQLDAVCRMAVAKLQEWGIVCSPPGL